MWFYHVYIETLETSFSSCNAPEPNPQPDYFVYSVSEMLRCLNIFKCVELRSRDL